MTNHRKLWARPLKAWLVVACCLTYLPVQAGRTEEIIVATNQQERIQVYDAVAGKLVESEKITLSDREWRDRLPAETYDVMRQHGTERPFTCSLLGNKKPGLYVCAACDLHLFVVAKKFDSGTGWPSFNAPVHPNNIGTTVDYKLGRHYPRTEVHCARCSGHLGHVFDDGPPPTGLRYCINGVAIKFIPEVPAHPPAP